MTPQDVDFYFTVIAVGAAVAILLFWALPTALMEWSEHRARKAETEKWAQTLKRFRGEI